MATQPASTIPARRFELLSVSVSVVLTAASRRCKVFHDALKGYACCSKRVTDFNDFLSIPGCTLGKHIAESAKLVAAAAKPVAAPAPVSVVDGKEVYGTATASAPAPPASAPKSATPSVVDAVTRVKEEDLNDPQDAVIPVGAVCKRKACGHAYVDSECREKECVFHPGSPVFHEGSKGWSCCSRKVLEFDEFLKIQGCKVGKHRFTEIQTDAPKSVECRRDWYQTPTTVVISIFAKNADKSKTVVEFKADQILITAPLESGAVYSEVIPLALQIDPEASKYVILSMKIEVTARKANGLSWPTLEPSKTAVKSFTTFGVRDGKGQDVALHLVK